MIDAAFIETLLITLKLAVYTTIILLIIGVPIAYGLAYRKFLLKPVAEALVSLPLVLPPTVLGYYMLLAYSPKYWLGQHLQQWFDARLAFTFEGVLIASVIFGLPFMVQPISNGFRALPNSFREISATLGKSKLTTLFRVLLPNIRPSLITAVALTFAHCLGEFGIVLMVGGNMPGETRVASIAIYDEVQSLNFYSAHRYALILFLFSFVLLTIIYATNRKYDTWKTV